MSNQNFKLHFKNPFDGAFDAVNDTAFISGVENEFSPKTYDKEHKDVYLLAFGVSIFCNIVSAATAATHINSFFAALIPYQWLVIGLTGVSLLVIELAKRYIAPKFFKPLIQFKKWHIGFLIVSLALMGLSTTFSYFGAKKVIFATAAPVELTDVAGVTNDYDKQIQDIENAKKSYFEANKVKEGGKEVLGYKSRKTYENFDNQLLDLRAKRTAAKESTESKNGAKESEHLADTSGKAEYFAVFTVIIEIIMLVCVFYVIYFRFRSFVDRTEFAENARKILENQDANSSNNLQVFTGSQSQTTQPNGGKAPVGFEDGNEIRTPIGFVIPSTQNVHNTQSVDSTQSVHSTQYVMKKCAHCGDDFERKVTFQKFCSPACKSKAWELKTGKSLYAVLKKRKGKK